MYDLLFPPWIKGLSHLDPCIYKYTSTISKIWHWECKVEKSIQDLNILRNFILHSNKNPRKLSTLTGQLMTYIARYHFFKKKKKKTTCGLEKYLAWLKAVTWSCSVKSILRCVFAWRLGCSG